MGIWTTLQNWFPAGERAQKVRLISGLILFVYVLSHYLNHAFGLISVEAMLDVQNWRRAFWRFPLMSILLYGALLAHIVFAVWRLVKRRTLKMPLWEGAQILLGIIIPYQLGSHIVATRGLYQVHGVNDSYVHELGLLWPGEAWTQTTLLLVVWLHSVIGLHFWLRMQKWYAKAFQSLFALAVFIPIISALGWIAGAREVALFYEDPKMTSEQIKWGLNAIYGGRILFFAVVAGLAAALFGPWLIGRVKRRITVEYPGNVKIKVNPGATLLEISRMNGIPHAAVCGGRARCSTCRVRIMQGSSPLDDPSEAETKVLTRIHADEDTRLACQIAPLEDIAVQPLVPARDVGSSQDKARDAYHWGVEQPVALLFADIRGFTSISEDRLPFDIVHLLNRYCGLMAEAIEGHGGYVDKFIGDGVMAIFGISTGIKPGCEAAIKAAADMGRALEQLNEEFAESLGHPLRIGVGVHSGAAILGRIGTTGTSVASGAGQGITALGDTVNTASRLESATKEMGAVCVISTQVLRAAGIEHSDEVVREIHVKGRESALKVVAFPAFEDLYQGIEQKQITSLSDVDVSPQVTETADETVSETADAEA